MKIIKISNIEDEIKIPRYLFHATYKENLDSILKQGLIPGREVKNWESSKNVVCMAQNPHVAYSYAETSEIIEYNDDKEYLLDEIVVLKIDTSKLEKSKFFKDSNIKEDEELEMGEICYEYHGIVPPNSIKIIPY